MELRQRRSAERFDRIVHGLRKPVPKTGLREQKRDRAGSEADAVAGASVTAETIRAQVRFEKPFQVIELGGKIQPT